MRLGCVAQGSFCSDAGRDLGNLNTTVAAKCKFGILLACSDEDGRGTAAEIRIEADPNEFESV